MHCVSVFNERGSVFVGHKICLYQAFRERNAEWNATREKLKWQSLFYTTHKRFGRIVVGISLGKDDIKVI